MNISSSSYFVVLVLFFFSGMSALIHQVAWIRLLDPVFGVSAFAVATVLASFMGGLAIGSCCFGKIADKKKHPIRIFILLEIGIGIYGLLMPALTGLVTVFYAKYGGNMSLGIYSLNVLRFFSCSLILVIPAALMGGTMPVLFKFLTEEGNLVGKNSGNLYFFNNSGAVAGCLLAGFFLIKKFGVTKTIMFSSAINILIALVAFFMFELGVHADSHEHITEGVNVKKTNRLSLLVLALFGIDGFIALVYEISWIRILCATRLLNTVYSFALVSATFITGLAIGGFIISRFVDRIKNTVFLFAIVELLIGLSAVASLYIFRNSNYLISNLLPSITDVPIGRTTYEVIFSFMIMLVPTILMGSLFPLVSRIYLSNTEKAFGKIGVVGFYDTIGSVFGAFAAGFVFISLLGMQGSILAMASVNILLGIILLLVSGGKNKILKISIPAVTVILFILISAYVSKNSLFWVKKSPSEELIYYKEDAMATVAVTRMDTIEGKNLLLRINICEVAGTGNMIETAQKALAHIPLLIYESMNGRRAERILQVGFGSGGTSWSASLHNPVEIICVELVPGVVEAAKEVFTEINHNIFDKPFFHLVIEDCRNYLRRDKTKNDVIMTDSIHPLFAGNASLYTRDYFELCRERLSETGVIVVWLPMWKLSTDDFKMVLKTFQSVFPQSSVWYLTNCINRQVYLIGTIREISIDREAWFRNILAVKEDLEQVNLGDPYKLLDSLIMSKDEIREYCGDAPINTEDMPILEFSAPLSATLDIQTWRDNLQQISKYKKNVYGFFAAKSPSFKPADNVALQKYSESSSVIIKGILKYIEMDYDGSYSDFMKAASINPRDKSIENILNLTKMSSLNRDISMGYKFLNNNYIRKAATFFMKALELDPTRYKAHEGMGIFYHGIRLYDKSIESFKKATYLNPESFESHFFLSKIYAETGNREEAIKELEEIIRMNHSDPEPYAIIKQVFERNGMGGVAGELLSRF